MGIRLFLFFVFVYGIEGIYEIISQPLYYLTRETWKLSATQIGLLGFIVSLAWYIKPVFGLIIDYLPIKKYRTKYYLLINTVIMLLGLLYVIIFGLNIVSYVVIFAIINICIAFNDVANDTQMVIIEQQSKKSIQAIQWSSLGIAGLIASLGGAYICSRFSVEISYKLTSFIVLLFVLGLFFYLIKLYKEDPIEQNQTKNYLNIKKIFKSKKYLLGLIFIFCLQFSPSFGTALMIKMREELLIDKMFIGYLGAMGTVLGVIGYLLYYWKFNKLPLKKLFYFSIIFSSVTNLFYLYIPNKWFLILYNILFGAFSGICFMTILSYMASICPKNNEGLSYAMATAVCNLSGRLSVIFGGWIYDNLGYNWNVITSSFLTFLCLFLVPYFIKERSET